MNHLFQGMQEQRAWSHEAALQYPLLLWKGSGCRCFRIKPKKGSSISLICHTQRRLCQRLPLACGDLGFGRVGMERNTQDTQNSVGKATPKGFLNILCKRGWKIKGQDSGINNISPWHKGILEEIRPLLLSCSFYLGWKGQAKRRRLGFCLLKTRPEGWAPTASSSRSVLLVHGWHLYMPRLNMLIRTVY